MFRILFQFAEKIRILCIMYMCINRVHICIYILYVIKEKRVRKLILFCYSKNNTKTKRKRSLLENCIAVYIVRIFSPFLPSPPPLHLLPFFYCIKIKILQIHVMNSRIYLLYSTIQISKGILDISFKINWLMFFLNLLNKNKDEGTYNGQIICIF